MCYVARGKKSFSSRIKEPLRIISKKKRPAATEGNEGGRQGVKSQKDSPREASEGDRR